MEGLYLHCNSHVLNYKPKYCWSNIPDHSERLTKSSSIKKLIVIIMKNKKQNKTNTRGYTMENQDRLGIIQMLHPNKHPSWTLWEPQSEALHWCHISQDRLPGGKKVLVISNVELILVYEYQVLVIINNLLGRVWISSSQAYVKCEQLWGNENRRKGAALPTRWGSPQGGAPQELDFEDQCIKSAQERKCNSSEGRRGKKEQTLNH